MAEPELHHVSGKVARKRVSPGSKSEREAIVLVTSSGELTLRRKGGHPLKDEVLEELVGKRIAGEALRSGQVLTLVEWREL